MKEDGTLARGLRGLLSVLLAMLWLDLYACLGVSPAQDQKPPDSPSKATSKNGRDPLSKKKGGTREAGGSAGTGEGAVAAEAPAASSEAPAALDPARRTFVVDDSVIAVANKTDCQLTSGDVVTRLTDTPDPDQIVKVSVAVSKKGDCAAGATVGLKVDDLQEMNNHFQEQLTNGLAELAKKQGTKGVPKAPDTKSGEDKKTPKKKPVKPSSDSGGPGA